MSSDVQAQPAPRLQALDAARILATFGIVWTHVAEGQGLGDAWSAIGRFGTSFYVIVAALFVVQSTSRSKPKALTRELAQRTRRLLRPFVVWCAIYGAYYGARGIGQGYSWLAISKWWGPLAGTAVHLWFLPFVFVWGLLASLASRPLLRREPRTLAWVFVAVVPLIYWYFYRHLFLELQRPWLWKWHLHRLDRWIVEVPPFLAAVLGACFYFRLDEDAHQRLKNRSTLFAVFGLLAFRAFQALYAANVDAIFQATLSAGRFMANAAGLALLLFFLGSEQSRWVAKLAPLGKYTYGAFLSHMLFIELQRGPIQSVPGYGSLPVALGSSLAVFAVSLALSALLQKVRWLRWLRP